MSNCSRGLSQQYGLMAKSLHWISALLVLLMLPFGFVMEDFAKAHKDFYYNAHKSIGLIILALIIWRLFWRLTHKSPPYNPSVPMHIQILAKAGHIAIYLSLLVMPLSGWVMSTAGNHLPHFLGWFYFPMPGIPLNSMLASLAKEFHESFAWALITLIVLHILAVFIHQCIYRDNVLMRMMPVDHGCPKEVKNKESAE